MNNSYILLRNNSESNSLSLEDLERIGLLPNDLLWVECQSVCWQRPEEIPELKKLLTGAALPAIKARMDDPREKYTPYAENENSTDSWKDRVTKDKTELPGSLLKLPLKKIALYAGLVAAGALAMLLIRGGGGHEPMRSQAVSQQMKTVTTTAVEALAPDSTTTAEIYDQKNNPIKQTTTGPAAEQIIPEPSKKEAITKNETTKKETTQQTNETPADYTAAVGENKEVKKEPVENIASKLQLKLNEYTVAAFGGIRNLKVTLQNNSPYLLDHVSVELNYLNPEGTVVKTETIDFKFVEPGAEATVAVKRSTRGVKLDYKISRIESKEMAASNSAPGETDQFSKN